MIPTLAFDNSCVTKVVNSHSALEEQQQLFSTQYNYQSLAPKSEFYYRASHLLINELHVSAISHSAIYAQKNDDGFAYLLLPTSGFVEGDTDRGKYFFQPNHSAFLSSNDTKSFKTTARSVVRLTIDFDKINSVFLLMTANHKMIKTSEESRSLPLIVGDMNFAILFESLYQQINSVACNHKILSRLRIDELFYRMCAYLLHQEHFLKEDGSLRRQVEVRVELRALCEWLNANLTEPVSLTEMERMSGLSARVLQYSFRKSFGLSPKEWLRKQRLHAARAVLLNPNENITLTSLTYDFCFSSPSEFSQYYQHEFGELPSQTMKRLRRRS